MKNYNTDTLNNYYNVYTLFNIYNNIKDYKKIICDTLNYSIENTLKKIKEGISTDLDNTVKSIEDSILDYENHLLELKKVFNFDFYKNTLTMNLKIIKQKIKKNS